MAECFAFHLRCSFYRNVLFGVIIVVFNVVRKSTSNQQICSSSNRRNVSYFIANIGDVDWTTAWQECVNQGSNLPVICNKDDEQRLKNYLIENVGNSAVWTSGKKTNLTDWAWANGQRFIHRDGLMITSPNKDYTHCVLYEKLRYKSMNPGHRNHYLCQFSGSQCSSENITRVTNGCVRPSVDDRTWYDARNQCLMSGGDLAILDEADLATLSGSRNLVSGHSYWIGLRMNIWLWIYKNSAIFSEEIKYTNWSHDFHYASYDCISINASKGEWKAVRCSDKKRVVCERNASTSSGISGIRNATSGRSTEIPTAILSRAYYCNNRM